MSFDESTPTRFMHELEVGAKLQDSAVVLRQQASDGRGLVARGAVDHEVYTEVPGDRPIDHLEERHKPGGAVEPVQRADDLAGLDGQRGIQPGDAVALESWGARPGVPQQHRQSRRGAIQGSDLPFLIDGQDHGAPGRIAIQPADVVNLSRSAADPCTALQDRATLYPVIWLS